MLLFFYVLQLGHEMKKQFRVVQFKPYCINIIFLVTLDL